MKVLLVQTTRYLGDTLLSMPAARALHAAGHRVGWVGTPPFHQVPELAPQLSRVHIYRKEGGGPGELWRLLSELKEERYDAAVALHPSLRSALLARLAAPVSVASRFPARTVVRREGGHEIERHLSLLRPLGIDGEPRPYCPLPGEHNQIRARLSLPDRYLLVGPGTTWKAKRWPAQSFGRAASLLARLGLRAVFVGSTTDKPWAAIAAREIGGSIDLTGRTRLPELLAVVKGATAVLANDSALVHIADGCGVPVAAVYGPTLPTDGFAPVASAFRPLQTGLPLSCRPCYSRAGRGCPFSHHLCLQSVPPEAAVEAVVELAGL